MRKLLLVVVAVLSLPAFAFAASKNGIKPQSPRKGAKVASGGERPVFKGRISGPGKVWVYVSESKKTDSKGVIADDAMIKKAKRKKNGTFKIKADFYDYDTFWLNTPGTYYWQAHRISCEDGNLRDCLQEGPVVKFKVK